MNTESTAPAEGATAVAEKPQTLADTLDLTELFQADGAFSQRDIFKYHSVTGGALPMRRAVFAKIATATPEQVNAMTREARNTMFWLLKWEYARYRGTAKRSKDSEYGKKDEPLPKLSFATSAEAVSYRELMKRASNNLRTIVFGDEAKLWK